MRPSHFLWPRSRPVRGLLQAARCTTLAQVEARLGAMFPGGIPVLFSSGRSALTHALLISGLARGDKAGVFPFASHCVLDAVSRVATPTSVGCDSRLNVRFQQWGYVLHRDLSPRDIEDCVDSLLLPGGQLFPGGGGFEVWSLPKILGTTGGGVLWCHSVEAAIALRRLRDSRSGSCALWSLRLMGAYSNLLHALWQGAEPSMGRPSRLQTGEILSAIGDWREIATDRQRKLDIAWPLAPGWLAPPKDRLPCTVPVELGEGVNGDELAAKAGISSGQRMIERCAPLGNFELTRVLPIPIHQDVSIEHLAEMVTCIAPYVRRSE